MAEEVADDLTELLEQQLDPDRPQKPPQGFIISISEGGRLRRFHFAGGCWRILGEQYKRLKTWANGHRRRPHSPTSCKLCFPGQGREEAAQSEDGSGTSTSSSSTASGGGSVSE